ncbi:MAG: hypothetical protein QHC88_11555 [Achromobacter sp.]|nr:MULTISPECIES: hypothetical protein [Achromobacter]MDX3985878.1 hypothetical protein [Achromobacter sp.]
MQQAQKTGIFAITAGAESSTLWCWIAIARSGTHAKPPLRSRTTAPGRNRAPERVYFCKECIMENPFGDAEEPAVGHRQYLVLIAASKDNASLAQKQLENLKKFVDDRAAPLWIDAKGIGVLLTTDMVASEIWRVMLPKDAPDLGDTRNMLVLEIGKDWAARRDDKIEHWLASHVGSPLPPMPRGAGKKR